MKEHPILFSPFSESLKALAGKYPKLFHFDKDFFSYGQGGGLWISRVTQCDIDEILALIGFEFQVYICKNKSWASYYWEKGDGGDFNKAITIQSPNKLEAARQALISIVQEATK